MVKITDEALVASVLAHFPGPGTVSGQQTSGAAKVAAETGHKRAFNETDLSASSAAKPTGISQSPVAKSKANV